MHWEARIVSTAPFIMMLIKFRLSAPGLVTPYYATPAGEITVLLAGLISIVSYVAGLRVGNRPLQIVESAFVASESGTPSRASGPVGRKGQP